MKMNERSTRLQEGEGKLISPRLADVECALSVNSIEDIEIQVCMGAR
jgi:hypothetical protein